ncbi:nucleotide sugar dehydrogenase [Isobaculum melis]|uniref:UDP-glucose 6-dehydrogenase n=1 Tax=Isobaculum melis TaxID=142588 RepID=A0A1H9TCU9_9LACT|nr:nucleotide sugar dehydrogenase [Isobaculum melis]SER94991.1 UDPglucose 6-dehydrogenase [Isobaculum melis]
MKKFSIFGLGYVGLANALLLGQNQEVKAYDIIEDKINQLNKGISPLEDKEISQFLKEKANQVQFTTDFEETVLFGDYLIIATPTDYDEQKKYFDTTTIEQVIQQALEIRPNAIFVIKSTVPTGYTEALKKKLQTENIIFCPEFLREGRALYDNLYPSRIIVGERSERGQELANIFLANTAEQNAAILLTDATEAEAIKLFSNTYLALRVAYFNELDTYAETQGLNSQQIIEGVGLDPRIGSHYNNPSFGYGGYCLPKDTKQLRADYEEVPNNIIDAIVEANTTRKDFIAQQIIDKKPKVVGFYHLTMKTDSDNFRYSSVLDIMKKIQAKNIEVIIFEPTLAEETFQQASIIMDLDVFKEKSDLIIANRYKEELTDVKSKVYTRDIFKRD